MAKPRNGAGASDSAPAQASSGNAPFVDANPAAVENGASDSAPAQRPPESDRVAIAAPEGTHSCTIDGVTYDVDDDGLFFVDPAHHAALIAHFGG